MTATNATIGDRVRVALTEAPGAHIDEVVARVSGATSDIVLLVAESLDQRLPGDHEAVVECWIQEGWRVVRTWRPRILEADAKANGWAYDGPVVNGYVTASSTAVRLERKFHGGTTKRQTIFEARRAA